MGKFTKTLSRWNDQWSNAAVEKIEPEQWERVRSMAAGQNEFGFDPFGFNPEFLRHAWGPSTFLYRKYFRVQTYDIDQVIDEGPVMLVANHSGQVALDGFLIVCALLLDREKPRMSRSMVERWIPTLPFISTIFSRSGQVVGTRENARLLLRRGGCLCVFPEGVQGISKTFDKAYQMQAFGNGFMRLALDTNTPIVPVGVVGGEEQMPSIFNAKSVARSLGLPSLPITPAMLLLGPAGGLPLPVKYHIYFGKPMRFHGAPDSEDAIISDQVAKVKSAIDQLIQRGLTERNGEFF